MLSDDYPRASVTMTNGTVEPQSIVLYWTELPIENNGRTEVTFYAVEVRDPATFKWNQVNHDYNNLYLTYTYTQNTNLMANSIYKFRIRPKNAIGYSLSTSAELSVLSDGPPNSMTAPTSVDSLTSPSSMTLNWEELLDESKNGGDTPTYYRLEWYDVMTNPSSP